MRLKFTLDFSVFVGVGLVIYGLIKKDYLTAIIGGGFLMPSMDITFKKKGI